MTDTIVHFVAYSQPSYHTISSLLTSAEIYVIFLNIAWIHIEDQDMQKVAIQIYLDPGQNRALTYLSKVRKRSKAAIIRSCIEDFLANLPAEEDPVLKVIGLGDSGHTDISERHDEYLARVGD